MRIMSIQKDTKRVYKDFKLKNLGDYHDLNMQSNTLLLDVFESFHNKCHEIYELDPTHIFISTRIAMAVVFAKTCSKIRPINQY